MVPSIDLVTSRPVFALGIATALAIALGLANADARADDGNRACIASHARGQELRLAGKWVAATKVFRACSATSCPAAVTQDCLRWQDELRPLTPSVLIAATAPDGSDTVDARLIVDAVSMGDRLPTTSIDLDPGEHTLRLEHPTWGHVEERIVLREREKNRKVAFRFPPPRSRVVAETLPAPLPKQTSAFGIAMLGVGGAAIATGAVFGVLGRIREDELAGSPCGRNGTCATEDVDVVRQRYWIAGITAGVGLAALAIGIWQVFLRDGSPRAGVSAGHHALGTFTFR